MKPIRFMKRMVCLLLVLASFALPTALAASGSYYVNVSSLNVRTGPSSGYSTKKKLHKGDVVTYSKQENGWWYVRYSGGSGWVYRKYLSKVNSSSKVTSGSKYKTTGEMNLRSRASLTESSVIGKVKKGATVTVKKTSHGWAYITYNGKSGWIAASYLKKA